MTLSLLLLTAASASKFLTYIKVHVKPGSAGLFYRGVLMTFVATWLVTTVATLVACTLIPGLTIVGGSWAGPILFSLVLAAVNTGIKPIIKLLSLPINVLTLGIFSLFINAFMLELASFISRNLLHAGVAIDSLGTAILGSIVISIVSSIVISLTGLKKENLS